jgi:hypothetical protein
MKENKIYEAISINLKMLLLSLGKDIPDGVFERLGESATDLKEQWSAFYVDIMDGGEEGFAKHYDISSIEQKPEDGDEKANEVAVGGLQARSKLASMAMLAVCSSPLMQMMGGGGLMAVPHKKEEAEYVELTPEKCREIEFNV